MCGINGCYAYHYAANPVDRAELVLTRDHMAARGPDGSGLWVSEDERVGLGHRRLAIIDLSDNGLQPMRTADGRYVVTFNGEIYNYKEIRRELEARGYEFRTRSDTEVLLHLYADRGPEMVHALRGMFAFALWDALKRELFLARDPYGVKPLYYADDGWTVRFASQVKALLSGGKLSRDRDPAGQVGFFLWGSVPEPFTTYRDIQSVPAGSFVLVNWLGAGLPKQYFSIPAAWRRAEEQFDRRPSAEDRRERIRTALLDCVRDHLVADVRVGAFLSAGVDSGSLVALMRELGCDFETVTLGFKEFEGQIDDEAPVAAEVAAHYGVRHSVRVITEQEFRRDRSKIFAVMDQPSIDGINTWFISKAARELGLKVAVSGLGGDELFGGYPSFKEIPGWVRAASVPSQVPGLGALLRRVMLGLPAPRKSVSPKLPGALELGGSYAGAYFLRRGLFMPWELPRLLDRDTIDAGLRRLRPLRAINEAMEPRPRSTFAKISALESALYMRNQLLRDTDWASMAHSLEIRVPLVDSRLLAAVAPFLLKQVYNGAKAELADAPRSRLPEHVRLRRKTGFSTPIPKWLELRTRSSRGRDVIGSPSRPWAREWAQTVAAL